jgi:hypothetical protein
MISFSKYAAKHARAMWAVLKMAARGGFKTA